MKPPPHLHVGPSRWAVRRIKRMGSDFGETCTEYQTITLNRNQGRHSTRETLLHEALHALFNLTALDKDLVQHDDLEETVVRRLAPALLALLRDNPTAVAYWMEK